MSTPPHADWNQVGAAITALGDRIQAHFAGLSAPADPATSAEPFEQLGKSLDDALTRFRNAVNDPAIADAAKSAAEQFLGALQTEVDSASDSVSDNVSVVIDQASAALSGTTSADTPPDAEAGPVAEIDPAAPTDTP
ncbi:MAG: hypothetical protein U0R64_04055 [Candidatus Nanopelagicales bacterium]